MINKYIYIYIFKNIKCSPKEIKLYYHIYYNVYIVD